MNIYFGLSKQEAERMGTSELARSLPEKQQVIDGLSFEAAKDATVALEELVSRKSPEQDVYEKLLDVARLPSEEVTEEPANNMAVRNDIEFLRAAALWTIGMLNWWNEKQVCLAELTQMKNNEQLPSVIREAAGQAAHYTVTGKVK